MNADPYLAATTADTTKPNDGLDRNNLPHLTAQQRADVEQEGFLVLPGVLDATEIARWTAVVDRLDRIERTAKHAGPLGFVEVRNAIAKDHELKNLITHPEVFPLIADLMGPDIQIITTHSMVRGTARSGTTANRVALAWLTNQPFPGIAIVGPHRADQLSDCLAAGDVVLSASQAAWLDNG